MLNAAVKLYGFNQLDYFRFGLDNLANSSFVSSLGIRVSQKTNMLKDNQHLDPEQNFINLDGSPLYAAPLASATYKNPEVILGSAISFMGAVMETAGSSPTAAAIIVPISLIIAVSGNVGAVNALEAGDFRRYPETESCAIDRTGICKSDPEILKLTDKIYSQRIRRSWKIGAAATCTLLGLSMLQGWSQFISDELLVVGPPISILTWSWFARHKLHNKSWTIAPHHLKPGSPMSPQVGLKRLQQIFHFS